MPASGVIFSGNSVKALKNSLILGTQATIFSGSNDPTSVATAGTIGDLYIRTGTPNVYQKITSSGTDTNWRLIPTSSGASAGDINETSFSIANNQVAVADITGFAFANATVRSFNALVSVIIDATSDLFAVYTLRAIQKGASWEMDVTSVGDDTLIAFSITNAGQVQYTSGNYTGFVSGTMKFRAISTSV